jgi:hypothetical protein
MIDQNFVERKVAGKNESSSKAVNKSRGGSTMKIKPVNDGTLPCELLQPFAR